MGRVAAPHIITDDSALGGAIIEKSLRFEHGANSVLSRSFSSAGNQRTFTMSAWIKKCHPTNRMSIFSQAAAVGSNEDGFEFDGIELRFYSYVGGNFRYQLLSNADFRDPNAWYHIVASLDTPQATASNRAKIYINGTQITDLRVATYPSQNNTSGFFNNSSNGHRIGGLTGNAHRFDGYLADVYFIDGYAYDPSYFGYTESQTGIWRPKRYTGAYGSNGYHLELNDDSSTSTLGTDTSGNGNNFSASNFSAGVELVTNGEFNSDSNWTKDSSWTISGGKASNGGGGQIYQTISVVSGKIYKMKAIMDFTSVSSIANTSIGFRDTGDSSFYAYQATFSNGSKTDFTPNAINEMSVTWISTVTGNVRARCYSSDSGLSIDNWSVREITDSMLDTPSDRYATLNSVNGYSYNTTFANGNLFANIPASNTYGRAFGNIPIKTGKWYWEVYYDQAGGNGNYLYVGLQTPDGQTFKRAVRGSDGEQFPNTGGTAVRFATGDIINVAVDLDAGKWYIGRNGTYWYSGNPVAGTGFVHSDLISANARTPIDGLVPLFYNATGGATQQFSVNFGQQPLSYTPPTGYKTINSKNLPIEVPSIIRPQKHFDAILYTGDGSSSKTVSGLEFKPDLVWMKGRASMNHAIVDSVRGRASVLFPNGTGAEQTSSSSQDLVEFNDNGFVVGTPYRASSSNNNGTNIVAWCWKAGGAAVTNTTGNISAQVSVNDEAGFSIITYTGDGNSSGNVGTGLRSTQPLDWAIVKRRDSTSDWQVGHRASGQGSNFAYHLNLNDSGALSGSAPYHMGSQSATNGDRLYLATGGLTSSATYVAYVWQERPGYSKFGKYTGNGSADGPYVHLGFRPSWIMIRNIVNGHNWQIYDVARSTINPALVTIYANRDLDEEDNASVTPFDILSNGFKIRSTWNDTNQNNSTILYMAFAEQPGITPYDTQTNAR